MFERKPALSSDRHEALLCDIVETFYRVMATLYDATSLLLLPGKGDDIDRFFLSEPQLCRPFLQKLHSRFVKPQGYALASVPDCPTNVVATAWLEVGPSFPTCVQGTEFYWINEQKSPGIMSLNFDPARGTHPARFTLTNETCRTNFVPPDSKNIQSADSWADAREQCLNSLSRMFAIFWTKSIVNVTVASADKQTARTWTQKETSAARRVAENAIFGIRDFLHSKQETFAYSPPSYRKSISAVVHACVGNNARGWTPFLRDPEQNTKRFSLAFQDASVVPYLASMNARYPFPGRSLNYSASCPSFLHWLKTDRSTAARIVFMERCIPIKMQGDVTRIENSMTRFKKESGLDILHMVSMIETLDKLETDELEDEYRSALVILQGASMYFEFLDAIRHLCTMELLAAAV